MTDCTVCLDKLICRLMENNINQKYYFENLSYFLLSEVTRNGSKASSRSRKASVQIKL